MMYHIEDGLVVTYLGDGVYASYNGYHIMLTKGSHDNFDSAIYLDVSVFANLLLFAAAVKEPRNETHKGSGDCQDEQDGQGGDEEVN